jgi:carbonic anhydrase
MNRLALTPIVAAIAVAAYALTATDAAAELADDSEVAEVVAEAALSCEVRGITPARARQGRPSRLQIAWNPIDEAELVRGEDSLELKLTGAGGVLRGERAYALTGVELHARADLRRYPAEARFIHRNAVGDLVVIGLYLTEGEENPTMEALRAAVDAADDGALSGFDPRGLLPAHDARLVYADRTPAACAPHIIWTVLDAPIEASRAQLAALVPAAVLTQRADAAD